MCFACFALGHYKREKINFKIDKEGHEPVLLVLPFHGHHRLFLFFKRNNQCGSYCHVSFLTTHKVLFDSAYFVETEKLLLKVL